MREFSQRLQEGEEDALSPQLRARILAAVPYAMPAAEGAVSLPRRKPRLVLAWGAVASALLLCVVLSPLFLKNDNADMRAASTASSAATPEVQTASAQKNAGIGPGKSANAGGSTAGSASAESGTTGSASAAGDVAAQETSAAKSAGAREDKAKSFYSAPTAPSSPSIPPPLIADAAGRYAVKTASPAPLATDRNAPADNVSAPATLSTSETQKNRASKPAVLAQNRRESRPVPPAARIAAPSGVNVPAEDVASTSPHQNKTETPANLLSGATTTPQSKGAVASKSAAGMRPSVSPAKLAKASVSGKMSHSLARNSRYRKQADNDILLLVGNVEQSRAAINQAVTSSGGVVTSVKEIPSGDNSQATTLTLDVPASRLPALLSSLDALGERKPLTSASWRTQSHIAAGTPVNGVNPVTKGDTTDTDNSGHPSQSQNVAPSNQHSRMKSEAASSPSAPAVAKPKPSTNNKTPEARVRVTIRLEKK